MERLILCHGKRICDILYVREMQKFQFERLDEINTYLEV